MDQLAISWGRAERGNPILARGIGLPVEDINKHNDLNTLKLHIDLSNISKREGMRIEALSKQIKGELDKTEQEISDEIRDAVAQQTKDIEAYIDSLA